MANLQAYTIGLRGGSGLGTFARSAADAWAYARKAAAAGMPEPAAILVGIVGPARPKCRIGGQPLYGQVWRDGVLA